MCTTLKDPVPSTRISPCMYVDPVVIVSPNTFRLPVIRTSFDALKYVSPSNQSVSAPPPPSIVTVTPVLFPLPDVTILSTPEPVNFINFTL